ncbi:acyl-CoA N-acyltransferase [Staphylotrichum tortipilum]|uniref:N-alpha-acetyltransferase 40 n=1 Tax=Staphylotrichum tortipilum TaxID=2831512 RepID=A0AAN6MQS0_9PEZI|nr:acyl-CoA N-acyltransferase [Staphylotrichum longicolle]
MVKRKRAPTDPLDLANGKSDEEFIAHYLTRSSQTLKSQWTTKWTHPRTGAEYTISLSQPQNVSREKPSQGTRSDFVTCFDLIEQTSRQDYEKSAGKWHPIKKLKEMGSPELRYILVREKDSNTIRGFTSLMPTYEEGQPVIYCYEIHLHPDLQGTGLGSLLMSFHSTVAANLPPITKVMLTCFLSNKRGLDFYKKLGFEIDHISPVPRTLRGKTFNPDYVIMSKPVVSIPAAVEKK